MGWQLQRTVHLVGLGSCLI